MNIIDNLIYSFQYGDLGKGLFALAMFGLIFAISVLITNAR